MIALSIVKDHLKIDESNTPGDDYLQLLIDGAIDEFNTTCNRVLYDVGVALPNPVGNALTITKGIEIGALMLIGHWLNNREAVSATKFEELPMSTRSMWAKHRWVNI